MFNSGWLADNFNFTTSVSTQVNFKGDFSSWVYKQISQKVRINMSLVRIILIKHHQTSTCVDTEHLDKFKYMLN